MTYANLDLRFATEENMEKIKNAFDKVDIERINGVLSERELDNILHEVYNEIFYEDIRNGLIIDSDRLVNMVTFYAIDKKEPKRVKYLSWLLNKYYPDYIQYAIDSYVEIEYYEEAAVIRDTILVTEMPLEKE
jgi:hypothetical protein